MRKTILSLAFLSITMSVFSCKKEETTNTTGSGTATTTKAAKFIGTYTVTSGIGEVFNSDGVLVNEGNISTGNKFYLTAINNNPNAVLLKVYDAVDNATVTLDDVAEVSASDKNILNISSSVSSANGFFDYSQANNLIFDYYVNTTDGSGNRLHLIGNASK